MYTRRFCRYKSDRRTGKRSPSRLVLSLKVRLSLQLRRCELTAAFPWGAKRTGSPSTITPVLIPFLRTVYTVVQFLNPWTNTRGIFVRFQLQVVLCLRKV